MRKRAVIGGLSGYLQTLPGSPVGSFAPLSREGHLAYWYEGRGDWARSSIGQWEADGLSFGTAQWLDTAKPIGDLVFGRMKLRVYAHPKGILAVPVSGKLRPLPRDRFELTLREKFESPGDVQKRKVVIETGPMDGWGQREILSGPADVLGHVEWDPEDRRFAVREDRPTPEWSIVRQRKLR